MKHEPETTTDAGTSAASNELSPAAPAGRRS
jgi:hypothetical protein